ncbi:MAG: AAA family ATPase, partial [Mycobacterium sp.]|nr:AAA family ATPase [Mycobacterium sp.]
MDPRQVAVLIEKQAVFQDRTGDVVDLRPEGARISVTFRTGKTYRYGANKVVVCHPAQAVPIDPDVGVMVDGVLWENIVEAWHFDSPRQGWWHLFYGDAGKYAGRAAESVQLVRNEVRRSRTAEVLRYWREVAALLPKESSSLREGLRELTFLHPDSALHRLLECVPIEAREGNQAPPIYPFHTNRSQREAIDNGMHQPISIIDGPPGTGKTQTILNLIANILVEGSKTVAVVSSNNAAVENIRDKLIEAGFGYVAADLGRKVKRSYFVDNQGPRNQFIARLRAESVPAPPSERRLQQIDKRLRGLQETERELAQLYSQLAGFELERRHFQDYLRRHELPPEDRLPVLRWSSAKILRYIGDTDPELVRGEGMTELLDRVRQYFAYRSMRQVDAGDVDVVLRLHRVFYDKKVAELQRQSDKLRKSLERTGFEQLAEEQRQLSRRYLTERLHHRYARQAPCTYTDRYQRDWARFSRDYPVILSTCHSLQRSIGKGRLVDYLVIDEASQVDLLAAAIAMACCRNLIVVGDLAQLPFIDSLADQKMRLPPAPAAMYDYQRHSILSALPELYEDLPRVMLREHYRCDPSIIGFCNKKFYRDELVPFTGSRPGYEAMVVARTERGEHMRFHRDGGRTNQREIDVIRQEILPKYCAGFPPAQIGITTPYRKQANKATDEFIASIESDTVHSFQGREKDAVVMTTVLDERRDAQRGKGGLAFADQPQLVNVAVSRAKKRFVLVTNHGLMAGSRHLVDLIRYIRYHNPDKETFDSSVVSVIDLLYREYSARLR